jgi:hypothetical protein
VARLCKRLTNLCEENDTVQTVTINGIILDIPTTPVTIPKCVAPAVDADGGVGAAAAGAAIVDADRLVSTDARTPPDSTCDRGVWRGVAMDFIN